MEDDNQHVPTQLSTHPIILPPYSAVIPNIATNSMPAVPMSVAHLPSAAMYPPSVIVSSPGSVAQDQKVLPGIINENIIQSKPISVQPILVPNVSSTLPHTMHTGSGLQKGVIYAFSQYSPFISIAPSVANQFSSIHSNDGEGSNLAPEDVAEVRQSVREAAASSIHEHMPRHYSGKCQSGGELRLSELTGKLNSILVPEGFSLVGAKSPMLPGITLVAVVDKRYLPGDPKTITMLGFSGNCIGCGATGFRYFTEFSTHINLKLATQPKKQKHLKYYITQNEDGKWGRGPLIPWKGTETRKRSVPARNLQMFGRSPEVVPSFTRSDNKGPHQPPIIVSSIISGDKEPEFKKARPDLEQKLTDSNTSVIMSIGEPQNPDSLCDKSSTNKEPDPDFAFKLPVSTICGVRPVLLLCQHYSCKLPASVNDIIISDLLVDCFDLPDPLNQLGSEETSPKYTLSNQSIISPGIEASNEGTTTQGLSNVEQNAANMLINMSGSNTNDHSAMVQENDSWPSVNGNTISLKKEKTINNLPLTAAIILLTQHLCSLDDTCISKEQIELMLNKARNDMTGLSNSKQFFSSSILSSSAQLSLMVNLQCCASNGRVKSISSTNSFQNALYKALRWIHETFYLSAVTNKRLMIPNFVVVLSIPLSGPIEFGILVTGISPAKILAECLGISSIVQSLNGKQKNKMDHFEANLQRLNKQFKQTADALSALSSMFNEARENMVYVPFNAYAGLRIRHSQAQEYIPTVAPISAVPPNTKGIFANQAAMAQQLLKQLRNISENPEILDLPSFLKVELLIVVPPIITLYYLTVKRLCESGVLKYLGLESKETTENYDIGGKYVITYSDWPESISRWNSFVKNAQTSSDTLFLLIFDQAHRYSLPQGMPDVLPHLKEVFDLHNIIPVFVTSVPYMFQTRKSFIDPDNEVYWTDTRRLHGRVPSKNVDDSCVMVNDRDMIYFGMKEFCESTGWNQQYSLIRHEETFDIAVPKANRLNDISYSMVEGFVLLRLYQAALMVAGGIKPAEPYAVMSVIRMMNDMVESPLRNADGSGYMLMIRVPDKRMGKHFHEVLSQTRNSMGFEYRFDVIFDDGNQELQISDYFLERMRLWRKKRDWPTKKASQWRPKCLEELLDLPCILILSGAERSGETFPRSLKYADFNVFNHSSFHRSTIEAEIGSVACYLSMNAGTHLAMANKHVVMNNVRTSVGTTYLPSWTLQQASGESVNSFNPNKHGEDKCDGCLSKDHTKIHADTSTHFSSKYPLPVLLVSKPLWNILQSELGTSLSLAHLNSDPNTRWVRSNRPLLTTTKPDRMSRHYRKWTDARPVRRVLTTPGPSASPATGSEAIGQLFSSGKYRTTNKLADGSMSEPIDHEDKDNEDSDKGQYHPRCLLLSGPPQAGKTGAYLHFAHLLHRMLVRLKRVDVCDNCLTYTAAQNADATKFPESNYLASTNFVPSFLDSKFENYSPVHVCSLKNEVTNLVTSFVKEKGTSDALVILAKTASFDTYHHCDMCRFYRDGITNQTSEPYSYQLINVGKEKNTIDLQVYIPPIHMKHFIVDAASNTMTHLILKQYESDVIQRSVKTPILMISSSGEEEGLLNLYHSMEEADHVHLTFIRSSELKQYQKHWPNHTFVVFPDKFNSSSDSEIKNLVKAFATQNYFNETERTKAEKAHPIWPFVLMIPDNFVMWQKVGKMVNSPSSSDSEEEEAPEKKRNPESNLSALRDTASLYDLLATLESNLNLLQYGVIGVRPWSSYQEEHGLPAFLKTFFHSCILLNVEITKNVFFATHVFFGEDIDFLLKLLDENIPFFRFEHFTFMAKVTARVSWRGHDEMLSTESDSLVVQPDMETMKILDINAHLVLQSYLVNAGPKLFPLAVGKQEHSVLVIGPYLNLGPDIIVTVINCNRDIETKVISSECTLSKTFAGLIVYNCSKRLPIHFIRQFKFVKGAQVIFICKERYELRSEVLRLDLEENWRFRLRDEYQTATKSRDEDNKPLFFLTGSYCS